MQYEIHIRGVGGGHAVIVAMMVRRLCTLLSKGEQICGFLPMNYELRSQ